MRIFRIVNVVPNDHSNERNNDSEPSIAVNPVNPHEMVITAFTPTEAGNSNGPLFFSTDGGENWGLRFDIPGGTTSDQSPAFARTSSELYMGILRGDNGNMNVLRAADPSTAGTFSSFDARGSIDQPWMEATSVVGGPDDGKDRIYVGYNDLGHTPQSATVDVCLDASAGSPTFTQVRLDPRSPSPQDSYEIRPTVHRSGTVYVAYKSWTSSNSTSVTANIVVARDDNWGSNNFNDLKDPSDEKAGRLVATGVVINDPGNLGGIRLDNDLNVAVDPTNSDIVYIVWCDNAGPSYTLRVRRSLNRGADWSGDLLVADNAALATLAINSQGTVGLFYQQLVAGRMETHFRSTSDGVMWDDTLLARTATSPAFTGDYARMVALGPHFYGVFPAMNTPDPANFFPNGGGTFRYQRNTSGTSLIGNDGATVIQASVDPFFFKVEEKDVAFILNRNPIGQDEVDARRTTGDLPMQDAFRVVVDGFTAAELGLAGPGSTLNVASPVAGMTITCTGNTSDTGSYGTQIQRFTFDYSIDFPDDSAFGFAGATEDLTLNVTAGGVPASALLTLIKQPDPFLLHGDPAWLSIDLRVFAVRPHETWFGATMGADASAAPGFIQQVMHNLTAGKGTAGGQSFDDPAVLSPDEDKSKLYLQPNDEHNVPVFNFALAKVHYIGLIGASNVRVFFRLRQTQVTYAGFDYPPGGQYRRASSNPDGQPIALAGIQGNEYVTVPCFANGRIDSTTSSMDQQTDGHNIQSFTAIGGPEVDNFYGCWLDINQPDLRLPVEVPPQQDGPFDPGDPNPNFRPVSLKQALARNLHLCLIAEIDFDPTPIPLGKDPSNWDKLAQRNIAWSDVGSAQAVTTFEIRPTPMGLPAGQTPDELMIDWGSTPPGSTAQIYLPAVKAADVLAMATKMYTSHRLTRLDEHTLQCKTGGITYVPVPPGGNINYAGLLSVVVPEHLPHGNTYTVAVRQVTNAFGRRTPPPPPPPAITERRRTAVVEPAQIEWRRVVGAFQLTIPVKAKATLLKREERDYSVLLWIAEAIPHHNRWHPVFSRYLQRIAGRVSAFGGNPAHILPSPTGEGRHLPGKEGGPEARRAFTGKIAGLVFDCFGDFEGFLLDTEDGERRFSSREKDLAGLAERVWRERLRITVWAERDEPHRPLSIIVREPPTPFED
ncbi:hypothetical protein KY49_3608 [Burkholderia sp. MSHR3999]|uniref:hypothetical protein n=1 Tax=Burkholderia sp. MSHR3999 TaxID=1542965 RepID=UPI0005B71BCA|nr:hypothetical protein [Burkholderia sp. MSHR3999]KIP17982.1 hypothetical protein KY49_3608 [Burkholderia sp. MSHR3999]